MSLKSIFPALCIFLPLSNSAQEAEWIAGSGTLPWADSLNWNQETYPGSATSLPDLNVRIAAPHTQGLTVTLDEALPTFLRDLRFDAGQQPSKLVLNLDGDTNINATSIGNTLLTINEGGSNGPDSIAEINLSGQLTIGQIRLSRDADGPTSHLNILPGGFLNMTGGGHFVMRTDSLTGTSIFNMSGGSFTSGGNRTLEMGSHDSQVHFSGTANFDGSNLTLGASFANESDTSKTSLISVTGSEIVNLTFKAIQGWVASTNTEGSTTFQFNTDFNGIFPILSTGDFNIAGDSGANERPADLVVDLTGYASNDDLILFDLTAGDGSVLGEFGQVTVIGGNGLVDYNYNDNNQIALTSITLGAKPGRLAITKVIRTGTDLTLEWNDQTPAFYTIETTSDLSSETWEIFTSNASGGSYSESDVFEADSHRFFRIRPNQ